MLGGGLGVFKFNFFPAVLCFPGDRKPAASVTCYSKLLGLGSCVPCLRPG